jgi:hypothetical protein
MAAVDSDALRVLPSFLNSTVSDSVPVICIRFLIRSIVRSEAAQFSKDCHVVMSASIPQNGRPQGLGP